jgi:hypothetical protein
VLITRRLMNKLVPGSISNIYTGEMAFKQVCLRSF